MISLMCLTKPSRDQFGFTPGVRIEAALMIAESLPACHLDFNIIIWFVSLDLRKAFDRVDHNALFKTLRHCGLLDGYIAFIQQLYADQHGSANRSDAFDIKRRVNQGDMWRSLIFNCILDFAMAKCKRIIPDSSIFG